MNDPWQPLPNTQEEIVKKTQEISSKQQDQVLQSNQRNILILENRLQRIRQPKSSSKHEGKSMLKQLASQQPPSNPFASNATTTTSNSNTFASFDNVGNLRNESEGDVLNESTTPQSRICCFCPNFRGTWRSSSGNRYEVVIDEDDDDAIEPLIGDDDDGDYD